MSIFEDLFTIEPTAKVAAQINPPTYTANAPQAPQTISYKPKAVGTTIGTTFVIFPSQSELDDLKENLTWLYENNNKPFSILAQKLDLKANITSKNNGTQTSWRDFVIGLYKDKVKGKGDFTVTQLKNIERLFAHVGFPILKFKKV